MFRSAKPILDPGCSDADDLMFQVRRGDMKAYQELVQRYQKKVYRVISSYHRDPEDATEVVQDTFLKVYTSRQTWEPRRSFSAWLYRIAINASIDRYRRQGKEKISPIDDVMESRILKSGPPPRTPLDKLRDAERRRVLEEAVRRLPERQREVLSLRYFAEMQLEEIAEALDCPLGTVKSNLHKAVIALKDLLVGQKEVLGYE
jgi:RNA polymerase sigma-70 factor (ECF subfamily)